MTDAPIASSSPQSVFITGASTAIGHNVIRRLVEAGYRVTGAVRTSDEAKELRAVGALPAYPGEFRDGELRSALKAAQATVLVHLAPQALNHVPHINARWEDAERMLNEGTHALVRAADAAGVQYLIFVGYAFAGEQAHDHGHDDHGGHDEEEPSIVDAARAAEQVVLHSSVPSVVLRAGYIYGPHSPETIALRNALKGLTPVPTGDEHASANWIHADDLASAIQAAIEKHPTGLTLDIVDNTPASPAAFVGYLAQSINLSVPSGKGGLFSRPRPGKTQAALLSRSVHASNAKAREALGWTPHYPSYREGLDQTFLVLRAEEPVF